MFKPLDIMAFDTDWPFDNGKITGIKDIRVIVTKKPSDFVIPSSVAITDVLWNKFKISLCTRGTHTANAASELIVTRDSANGTGRITRASNQYMTVDVTTVGDQFQVASGSLPLLVVPCCVIWLVPSFTSFSTNLLPDPATGWSMDIDYKAKRVIYRADTPGSQMQTSPTDSNPYRLRCVNGMSPIDLSIKADGGGRVEIDGQKMTIAPAERDIDDAGRTL